MSNNACCTWASCVLMFKPPIASARFSWPAIHLAAALVAAPWLSANTLAPRAWGLKKASAWMLMNKSACTRRAFCTRCCKGMKKSASRVNMARMGKMPWRVRTLARLMRSRKRRAICNTTSFSRVPRWPKAPGSSPPWPGSSATTTQRSDCCGSGAASGGAAIPGRLGLWLAPWGRVLGGGGLALLEVGATVWGPALATVVCSGGGGSGLVLAGAVAVPLTRG